MLVLNNFIVYWKPAVWSLLFLLLLTIINTKFFLLQISGIYFIVYVVIVWMLTIWLTFKTLQNFLQQNKALNLNLFSIQDSDKIKNEECDLSCVKQLTVDIDRYFINKWFTYISKDDTFNKECQAVLEEVLRKIINVQLNAEFDTILHGILNIYLKHLKEFRRALKRKTKYGGKISKLYRYSHVCTNSSKSQVYFVHQLTANVLNQFINWELSNSLPCRILVSIIAKTFSTYMLHLLSDPQFLNYYILKLCCPEDKKNELNLINYSRVKLEVVNDEVDKKEETVMQLVIDTPVATLIEERTLDVKAVGVPEKVEIIENMEDVKIYEPRSCKTWRDSYDLESVTLGQDILDMLNSESEENGLEIKEEPSPMSQAKSLLDEVKQITSIEGIKTSMKPISDVTVNTLHNIKDFHFQESTVNNVVKPVSQATSTALHKIGGLQDEAAGVVEGIWDFGRTKIRKGLRLTGLEGEQTKKKTIAKLPHVTTEDAESVWINPLQEEPQIPRILHEESASPDPEYEETADLATSIAKLRSLLEQKSSESTLSTPSLSPMPPEEFSNNANVLANLDVDEVDGVMPSFYKFCAKTATGVIHNTLNTIKTALPGSATDLDCFDSAEKWLFVASNPRETDLFLRMNKLLSERKVFCTIDAAYEAIDSLVNIQESENLRQSNIQFEDELDDFEVKLPITKAVLDIICEMLSDCKNTSLTQEPVIKSVLLLFGNYIEETITTQANINVRYWCTNAQIPSEMKTETLSLSLDSFVETLLVGIPDYLKCIVGGENLKHMLHLFVSSLQIPKINQDIVMQIFEIVSMKLMDGSRQLSPMPA